MNGIADQITAKIVRLYAGLPPLKHDPDWLGLDPNIALLLCVGSGPWKMPRRMQVQAKAIVVFWHETYELPGIPQDISQLDQHAISKIFPLEWQRKIILSIGCWVRRHAETFHTWSCGLSLKSYQEATEELLVGCGGKPDKGPKVVWMFARDFLKIPAFPIDRHVGRFLRANDLPIDSRRMVDLCLAARVNPSDFARRIFIGENPDREEVLRQARLIAAGVET